MMDNYYQELLDVLSKNRLTFLPSSQALASSEELALMCWQNFDDTHFEDDGYFDYVSWYQKGNWKQRLAHYKNDTNFWQKAFSLRNMSLQCDLLLMKSFQHDFPEITKFYLDNNERLLELFEKSNREEFFDLIKANQEEKDSLYKDFILKKDIPISPEQLRKFENDKSFLIELLKKQPSNYQLLNARHREDEELVEASIAEFSNLHYMSFSIRNKFFDKWLQIHISRVDPHRLSNNYSEEERKKIFVLKPHYIAIQLDNNFNAYKGLAVDYICNTLDVTEYTGNQIIKLFKRFPEYQRIMPQLEKFIINYKDVEKLSKDDKKIADLIMSKGDLAEKLKANIFYQVNSLQGGIRIDKEAFHNYFEKTTQLYENQTLTIEQANKFMNRCVDKLVDKGNIPNINAFSYLYSEKLKNKLDDSLNSDNVKTTKRKI